MTRRGSGANVCLRLVRALRADGGTLHLGDIRRSVWEHRMLMVGAASAIAAEIVTDALSSLPIWLLAVLVAVWLGVDLAARWRHRNRVVQTVQLRASGQPGVGQSGTVRLRITPPRLWKVPYYHARYRVAPWLRSRTRTVTAISGGLPPVSRVSHLCGEYI